MDTLYVLFFENRLVGVYTSHRKAMQTMIHDTVSSDLQLVNYDYDFGIEYFTYYDADNNESTWELQEVTPDARA